MLHPLEPKDVEMEQSLVLPARTGKESSSPLHEGPCTHGGFLRCLWGVSERAVAPLRFLNDSRGVKSCQVLLAQEGIWEQLINSCNCGNKRAHVCCVDKSMVVFNPCQLLQVGLMALWQGEPGPAWLPEGSYTSALPRPFLFTAHT